MLFECCANFLTCDRRLGTQSAVLSEVLNGTNHLRGVGVLVVVPRHDLNLIGVVAATLNFCTFPSSSSQFCNNSYSTTAYRCRTKTGLFVPKLYHVWALFSSSFAILCFRIIIFTLFLFMHIYFHVISYSLFGASGARGSRRGRSPCPDALLRVSDDGLNYGLIGALMDWLGRWVVSDFRRILLK